jgi:PAS domain S-box-containing protein
MDNSPGANQVEEKLRKSEQQLSLIYNCTTDMMLLISVEPVDDDFIFRFVSANKSYMNTLKSYNIDTTEDELTGKTINEAMSGILKLDQVYADKVYDNYSRAARSKVPVTYEEALEQPGVGRFYSETTLTPIFDDNARCTHLLYVCRDITQRKLAEEEIARQRVELNRSNEELQQFAYVASHDLQEPLRMVGCFVQLLEKKYKNSLDNDANEYINFTVDGVRRMQSLIQGLLEYSRISTRDYQYSPTDFNRIVQYAKANLMISIEDNHAVINNSELPVLKADENQMIRLVQNLLSNAIKYRREEAPIINISARETENEWIFSVQDNGIGIKEEYFERIFNIFQRLHTREIYSGEGLGLAICKKIIERHQGRIWLESEPGRGTTFFFSLPL